MSKEQILKEFIQELLDDVILGKSEDESVSVFRKNISIKVNDFYSKISSQTREETIREIEEKVRELRHELGQEESLDKTDREYFKEGHSKCLNEVLDILNKLKK